MNKNLIKTLNEKADEFGNIAKNVNKSSKERKDSSLKALKSIDKSLEIGDKIVKEIKVITKSNVDLRAQDTYTYNICKTLEENIKYQIDIVTKLKSKKIFKASLMNELLSIFKNFHRDLKDAMNIIQRIVTVDNEISLMDNLIQTRKNFQKKSIKELKILTTKSLKDAEKAIQGSSSNLDRGLKMVKQFQKVGQLLKKKDRTQLNKLIYEANRGWKIAVKVNNSSKSQLEFAEKVNRFTKNLHDDSENIKNIVTKKHELFKLNLEDITVLTVMLTLQFKNYFVINDILLIMAEEREELTGNIRESVNNLFSYVKMTCDDINNLAKLKYDMTDTIHLNAEIEIKTVELTKKEIENFGMIKEEVNAMTEATKYPIEGSGKNIKNGQILEEKLKKVVSEM